MKKIKVLYKQFPFTLFFLLCTAFPVFAQDQPTAQNSSFVIDANAVLVFAVALLAIVIAALGYTLSASLDLYKRRKTAEKNKAGQTIKVSLGVRF